jgi:hypothetical protein
MTTLGKPERRPIYVHQDIDDLPVTVEAFRVYMHLARRSGKDNVAWPSYTSIGEHCFRYTYPKVQSASLRRKAIRAVKELEKAGVILVHRRKTIGHGKKGNNSNVYKILPLSEWKNPDYREYLMEQSRRSRISQGLPIVEFERLNRSEEDLPF